MCNIERRQRAFGLAKLCQTSEESKAPHGLSIAASPGGAGDLYFVARPVEAEHCDRSCISLRPIAESTKLTMET